jgi:hypothetical protein
VVLDAQPVERRQAQRPLDGEAVGLAGHPAEQHRVLPGDHGAGLGHE